MLHIVDSSFRKINRPLNAVLQLSTPNNYSSPIQWSPLVRSTFCAKKIGIISGLMFSH